MAERLTRQEQQERTREQLIDAAMELFADHGIANVSLDRVASAIGRTKGAVYANFASKDELIAAVIERHMSVSYDDVPNFGELALRDDEPADVRFGRIGEGYARAVARRRRFAMFLLESWLYAQRNESARGMLIGALEAAVSSWERNGAADGAADGLSPHELGRLALAIDIGVAFQSLLDDERFPAQVYAKGLRRLFAGATLPPSSSG